MDYHGLKLLWGWMMDVTASSATTETLQFRVDLLSTLTSLPVPNKTMLLDSKVLPLVEKWGIASNSGDAAPKKIPEEASTTASEQPSSQSESNNPVADGAAVETSDGLPLLPSDSVVFD